MSHSLSSSSSCCSISGCTFTPQQLTAINSFVDTSLEPVRQQLSELQLERRNTSESISQDHQSMDPVIFAQQLKSQFDQINWEDENYVASFTALRKLALSVQHQTFRIDASHQSTIHPKRRIPATHVKLDFVKPANTPYASIEVGYHPKYLPPHMLPPYHYKIQGRPENSDEDDL